VSVGEPLELNAAIAEEDNELQENIVQGNSTKTLADTRLVIGDYVACSIYPPGPTVPPPRGGGREGFGGPFRANGGWYGR